MTWNKIITSKILRSPPWLGSPLCNICVTNDHGYVPLVVNPSRSFPHSLLKTGCVTILNNSMFGDLVDHIYPIALEIKDTTYTDMSASHLDLHPVSDNESQLRMKLTKEMIYIFPLWTFHICSNIPAGPAYGVFISQMIRETRACGSKHDKGLLLNRKLLNQGFILVEVEVITLKILRSPPWLVDNYGISVSKITTICSTCPKHVRVLSSLPGL